MNLIRHAKKIRALDLLNRIQSYETNTKLMDLKRQVEQEEKDIEKYSAIKASIASFDDYEEISSLNKNSDTRYSFAQQYIDILLANEVSQKTILSNNEKLMLELTKDIQHSYNLNKSITKKLKSERISYMQAINDYDAKL